MIKALNVYLHERHIGTLMHIKGKNLFTFEQEYIDDLSRPTLSLSFKDFHGDLITDIKPLRIRVPHFFSNLLPEGGMREYLALHDHINPLHEFQLLSLLGQDLPGAVTILPADVPKPILIKEPFQEVEEKGEENILRFSLAGIQMKFSALEEQGKLTIPVNGVGGGWIIKLPSPIYPHLPENEYSMMNLAKRIGIHVPEIKLVSTDQIRGIPEDLHSGSKVYVIKRFDREKNHKVHIEDFAQVFTIFPEQKYQKGNYRNIATLLWNEVGEKGLAEFIRRLVFNALIGNGDMHLKNWSLIYPDARKPDLSPAYDFVSTIPYIKGDNLALNFTDSKNFTSLSQDQFQRFAVKAEVPEHIVLETVDETVAQFKEVWNSSSDLPLPKEQREIISLHIQQLNYWK